jgi:hypothetical protein
LRPNPSSRRSSSAAGQLLKQAINIACDHKPETNIISHVPPLVVGMVQSKRKWLFYSKRWFVLSDFLHFLTSSDWPQVPVYNLPVIFNKINRQVKLHSISLGISPNLHIGLVWMRKVIILPKQNESSCFIKIPNKPNKKIVKT